MRGGRETRTDGQRERGGGGGQREREREREKAGCFSTPRPLKVPSAFGSCSASLRPPAGRDQSLRSRPLVMDSRGVKHRTLAWARQPRVAYGEHSSGEYWYCSSAERSPVGDFLPWLTSTQISLLWNEREAGAWGRCGPDGRPSP